MAKRRVLAIGLDGYDPALGDRLMGEGLLPNLAALRQRAVQVPLDHGVAKHTGLGWEHFATGLTPAAANRWAAVSFDPQTYEVWQAATSLPPFTSTLDARTVVFDPPYFSLERAPGTTGIIAWGAHDPGGPESCRPAGLRAEMDERFGPYPAAEHIYGLSWPSPELTREAGRLLPAAVDLRAAAAAWLFGDRLPAWDLAVMVVSELHSAIEALWHGEDESSVLHSLPSAPLAHDALMATYAAVDRLVGSMVAAFPDATIIAFSLHGMGPNLTDVPDMVLLPDLLLRRDLGRTLIARRPQWDARVPMLEPGERWESAVLEAHAARRKPGRAPIWVRAARRLPGRSGSRPRQRAGDLPFTGGRSPLDWMPAARYREHWPAMRAFALPSFYDGQVRLNLAGRERAGRVPLADYRKECEEVIALLHECRDFHTGEPIVRDVTWDPGRDPLTVGPTRADIVVTWRRPTLGFVHPVLGTVGPVPVRRPGGHEGGYGVAFVAGPGIEPAVLPLRSSFDVVPTIIELLGEVAVPGLAGASFAPDLVPPSPPQPALP